MNGLRKGEKNNNPICKVPECQKTSVALRNQQANPNVISRNHFVKKLQICKALK